MATGNLTIAANVTGGADGSWSLNSSRTVPTAVSAESIVTLIVGSTVVSVPTGVTNAVLVPPNAAYPQPNPNYAGTLTLKGASGDTGVPISTYYNTALEWDSATAPSSFTITATATGSMSVRFF